MTPEITDKMVRLNAFLDRHNLDGVLLQLRNNFAWITGGLDNHIVNSSSVGVASILATRDKRVCITNTIEGPRFRQEELSGTDIDTLEFPWWDAESSKKSIREIIGSKKIASDVDPMGLGLLDLPGDFAELRWTLTDAEIGRYRDSSLRNSHALEAACLAVRPGHTEMEAAGIIDHFARRERLKPAVTLVASDDRITKFRHPIPTAKVIGKIVMLVSCAESGGLISCLTRFVSFVPLTSEQKQKQQAIANIDAAVNLATKPGRTLGEIFKDLQQAYTDNAQDGQWKLHHQGGSTGYAGREAIADPFSTVIVRDRQPFAWNPSIIGAKSEDTVLVTQSGIEVLTKTSSNFPTVAGSWKGQTLLRPDILVAE